MGTETALHRDQPAYYRIYFQGILDPSWAGDFVDMTLERLHPAPIQGITLLKGKVVDQAALIGILNMLYDLGFPLLRLECFPYRDE
jgi:hypothetical protein